MVVVISHLIDRTDYSELNLILWGRADRLTIIGRQVDWKLPRQSGTIRAILCSQLTTSLCPRSSFCHGNDPYVNFPHTYTDLFN